MFNVFVVLNKHVTGKNRIHILQPLLYHRRCHSAPIKFNYTIISDFFMACAK